jgi:hypothetical protein
MRTGNQEDRTMAERAKCVAVAAQTGKPCRSTALEGSLVCAVHAGQTKAQKAALKRGQKKRKDALAKGGPTTSERWAMLISGTLTVKDLDDDEIHKMRLKGKGGEFSGRARAIPSHLLAQFEAERQTRWKRDIMDGVPEAVAALIDIVGDPDHKDRAKMAQWFVERALGKTPDVVQVHTGTDWDRLSEAVVIDRGMADGADAFLASESAKANAEE